MQIHDEYTNIEFPSDTEFHIVHEGKIIGKVKNLRITENCI